MRLQFFCASIYCLAAAVCHADVLSLGNNRFEGTVNGIRNGKVSMTIKGTERQVDMAGVTGLSLDDVPKLAEAEAARADEPKKAAALYKQLIPTINKPDLKLLIEWRAIDPTDRDDRWTEAATLFLDVYQASPTDAVWNSRPSHLPGAGSTMLDDSAKRVTAAIKETKSDEAKKNLRKFLLDIYMKAGNTAEAQRIAREIATGIAEDPVAITPPPTPNPSPAEASTEISAALAAKNFDAALKLADAQLATAPSDTAIPLYALKAQALEGQNKLAEAAGAWLRIFSHYPASPAAPGALLNAARLEKKLNDLAAAKNLLNEILQKYPESKEAALAPLE